ncbi:hypothetical protein EJB05_26241 [Eragrostis curvula]|uniref:Uncharacterized protein n=1 Tax=Eragrostis curvula TaxID=38414 RepID=A0A5J9UKS0_9POAL|nr:hypothetical protein EJB05_26241 [Eragrostis curvula]
MSTTSSVSHKVLFIVAIISALLVATGEAQVHKVCLTACFMMVDEDCVRLCENSGYPMGGECTRSKLLSSPDGGVMPNDYVQCCCYAR